MATKQKPITAPEGWEIWNEECLGYTRKVGNLYVILSLADSDNPGMPTLWNGWPEAGDQCICGMFSDIDGDEVDFHSGTFEECKAWAEEELQQ